ncbi:MAG TPA: ATP-binding protein [Gemmatimonadaceae bacterium]|nr:ATP-binding protein [Gemmatimonadaceae bacterium]
MTAPRPESQVDILLVDDRRENLLALEAILEPLGQRLVRASSGEEALRRLLDREFAVILLDVQMPGLNGFETAKLIKSRERTRHVPIIFLTAISKDEEYVFEGYSVGAVDYMFKPFQPAILRSKVQVFVDLQLQRRRLAEQEQRLREVERQDLELRHMHELLQSEARFREIVDSAMDAIVVFDADGRITLINAAAERMFRTTSQAAVDAPVTSLFPSDVGDEAMNTICTKAERERTDPGTLMTPPTPHAFTARRATGESFPIETSVSCLDTPSGRTYTLIVRDISERVRHEEALRRQAESLARSTAELQSLNEELHRRQIDLERAMTARSRFYASMSHELRTPINAVLGYSTLLLEGIYGPLNEKQTEGIERTQKAARHLLELVNDVLDLSKIEAGKIDLRLQPVEFPSIIDDLFVTVRPLADEHGSTLSLDAPRDERLKVISDPRRLRQILLNLLSNAIKFGNGKPIRVVVAKTDAGGVCIEVIDQGEGISREDQERIFHEFVQLGKTQLQDGTGLGLPISRRLAELLDGTLTVESVVGKGSTFRLELPPTTEVRPARFTDQELERETPTIELRTPSAPKRNGAQQNAERQNGDRQNGERQAAERQTAERPRVGAGRRAKDP